MSGSFPLRVSPVVTVAHQANMEWHRLSQARLWGVMLYSGESEPSRPRLVA